MQNQTIKTWFITGASKGFGLIIVKKLLANGQNIAATSRNAKKLAEVVGSNASNFLPLEVTLGNDTSVKAAIDKTAATFGSIDVLINNAGYGLGGSLEEVTDAEIRNVFEINVFGTVNTIRHTLPYMRKQKGGHIINISSIAGFAPGIGWAPYNSTKFAVTGLTGVLAQDVKSLGIKVTTVSPGAFRTEFLTEDSIALPKTPIDAYSNIRETHNRFKAYNGKQAGNPDKGADIIINLGFNPNPPVNLFLGTDAYNRAADQIEALSKELEENKDISFSTDY
ncbi:SDR family NAD(P)-dependent oxidoreductase [Flavobacterium rhizosphaerae]|uniref:SDR family NAD(P)-dependent oxidoreductase n=1 Tax=Flavobacterium rhizosphaerae TaxID=3163298 RepID=A0ABW8Z0Y8_9FLAO